MTYIQPEQSMSVLSIKLFGPLQVQRNGTIIPNLNFRNGEDLLAILVLYSDHDLSTEWIANHLWLKSPHNVDGLRHSIKALRESLNEHGVRIIAGRHTYRFSTEKIEGISLKVDLLSFLQALDAGVESSVFETAMRLYDRGSFLETWNTKWVREAREKYRNQYAEALEARTEWMLGKGKNEEACHCLRRLIRVQPRRERNFVRLMEALVAIGERLEARLIYERYRDLLQSQSPPMDPPEQMLRLYHQILTAAGRKSFRVPELDPAFAGYEPVGGAMPLHSAFYLPRSADAEFHTAVARRDRIVLLKGARQTGKTSLLMRGIAQARQAGARVALTDFQRLTASELETAHSFFQALARFLADQLYLPISPADHWRIERTASHNFDCFLRDQILSACPEPFFWAIDEADRLFAVHYREEVFRYLRALCNERTLDPDEPLERLTLALAYSTEAHLFIIDLNQSPFNIVPALKLEDWTPEQVKELNRRYGSPLEDSEVHRLYNLVGGHPYLVRRSLHAMTVHFLTLQALEAKAESAESLFGSHLDYLLDALKQDTALVKAVRDLLRGEPCLDEPVFLRLRSAGIVQGETNREASLRCNLYVRFLARRLI